MKITAILAATATAISGTAAFAPAASVNRASALSLGKEGNVEFGGNSWKPDSEKMGVSFFVVPRGTMRTRSIVFCG